MKSFLILHCSLLLTSFLTLPLFADKPNVIVIMADDMGWECVSAYRDLIAKYNYPKAKPGEKDHYSTPNIDKFAAEGMRFRGVFVSFDRRWTIVPTNAAWRALKHEKTGRKEYRGN